MRFKGLQNIDSVLQTAFHDRFSQARLFAVAPDVVGMVLAILAPASGIIFSPVALVGEDEVAIFSLPALLGFVFLLSFAVVATAGDLAVPKAGMRVKRRVAERAAFFLASWRRG